MSVRSCSQCSTVLSDGARFCELCGTQAGRLCKTCGYTSQAKAIFCGGCGGRLQLEAARRVVPSNAPEGRRLVTVLFADICGYTMLSATLDAEELHTVVQAYFDQLERIVSGLGGMVERYIGDAVMCVFGAPIARHDDALRAVRAACEIQAAMPRLSREMGRTLQTTVGLAMGEVVMMGPRANYAGEVTVVGRSVNLAARIDGCARPGEVLVHDALYRQVAAHVEAEDCGLRQLKGIANKVQLWRVHKLVDPAQGPFDRLIGRAPELEVLRGALDRSEVEKQASLVVLRGEAGIGKSRLLEEVAAMARAREHTVQRIVFLDFGMDKRAQGFAGWAAEVLGLEPDMPAADVAAAVEHAVSNQVLPANLAPLLCALLSIEQFGENARAYDGMSLAVREAWTRECLIHLARSVLCRRPAVLLIEDVHWAGPQAVDRLRALTAALCELPVVVVVATRLVGDPIDADFVHRLDGVAVERITLPGLSKAEMQAMAKMYHSVPDSTITDCIQRSAGNPLFLEQLLRHARENTSQTIPGSVRSLVMSRLDRLGVEHRWALQAASVIGQRWTLDLLHFLLDDDEYSPHVLLETRLIRREGRGFIFGHALIHEGAYRSLLKRHASQLHRRAADWYRERDVFLRAQHLDRAGSEDAVGAYLLSVMQDIEAGRLQQAMTQLTRAGELGPSTVERARVQIQWGRLHRRLGAVSASVAAFREAIELSVDEVDRCRAQIGLATSLRLSDDIDDAMQVLDEAQTSALSLHLLSDVARIHYLRGSLLFPRAEIDGCLAEHGQALEYGRLSGDALVQAEALSGLGDAHYARGRMQSAHEYFQQCMEHCRRHGYGRVESANRFMVGTVRFYLHQLDGALDDALASALLAESVGNQRAEIVSRLTAGWVLISMGRLDEADQQATQGLAVASAIGANRFVPFLRESLARVAWYRGEEQSARRIISEAVTQVRDMQMERFIGPWLLGTLAMVDSTARDAALGEGWRLLEDGAVGHNYYHFHAHGIEAQLESGRFDAVESHAAALEAFTSEQPNPWADYRIRRARTLVAIERDGAGADELRPLLDEGSAAGLRTELIRIQRMVAG